jgi:hypothetical protein
VAEIDLISASLPPGRELLAGVYTSPHDQGGQPSTKYVYDLITLLLAQRTVTGAVIYDGYPSPGVNESCPTPLASEGCAVAAAYSPGTR